MSTISKKRLISLIMATFLCVSVGAVKSFWAVGVSAEKKYTIVNPYQDIDWGVVKHAKSALHCHSSNSGVVWDDGNLSSPDAMIKGYQNAGFDVLAFTDHDYVTYPWSDNQSLQPPRNVNTSDSTLLSMPANELSKNANQLAYGIDFFDKYDPNNIKNQTVSNGFDGNISLVQNAGGIMYFAHPRRNDPQENQRDKGETVAYSDLWWLSKFNNFPAAKGLEVLNCGQFSKNHSERLWDSLLTKSMPGRVIYGTASDDNHGGTSFDPSTDLGTGFTKLLLMPDKLNSAGLVDALSLGKSYFSTYLMVNDVNGANDDNKKRPTIPTPTIEDIVVDNIAGTITVKTRYASKVEWISGYDSENFTSKIVKTDVNAEGTSNKIYSTTINVENMSNLAGYVRIRIVGDGGQTHSQPFSLKQYYPTLEVTQQDLGINFASENIAFDASKYIVSLNQDFSSPLSSGSVILPLQTIYAKAKTSIADQPTPVFSLSLPTRPKLEKLSMTSRNETSLKLNKIDGAEYKLNDGEWQDSCVFTGLKPSTKYKVDARIKATATNFASETVSSEFSTKEGVAAEGGCNSSAQSGGVIICMLLVMFCGVIFLKRKRSI